MEKPVLGRFSSHLKIGARLLTHSRVLSLPPSFHGLTVSGLRAGICGMPNVGKSTLFNVRC